MSGRPGAPLQFARWTRERLLGLGLTDDQLVFCPTRPPARLEPADLEPASFLPEFAPLGQRLQRLLGGGRGLSVYVTGGRNDAAARQHAAVEIALSLVPQGREIVLVDADFLRPGLGGLVSDPLAEGVVDMIRFGRSTRTLLQKPLPEGPWVLPAGSFPADDPVPLDVDALRSLLYRVAQVCDLALYVGPLPIRSELHPLARLCDHVLVAAQEDEPDGGPVLVEHVGRLQDQGAHLAGIVVYAIQPVAAAPPPAPAAFAPGSLYSEEPAPPAIGAPASLEAQRPVAPPVPTPTVQPPVPMTSVSTAPAAEPPAPAPERWMPQPAHPTADPWAAPRVELPPLAPATTAPEPHREQREEPELAGAVATRRPRDEARGVARDLDLATAEFAFEAESRESRWPLLVVLFLLVLIVGFVSWALWTRHTTSGIEPPVATRVEPARPAPITEPAAPSGGVGENVPPAGGQVPPAASGLDDRAASATAPPTPPREAGTEVPAIPPPNLPSVPTPGAQSAAGSMPPGQTETGTTGAPAPAGGAAAGPTGGAPATSGVTAYAVHVASYKTLEQASRDLATLKKLGYEGRPVRTDLGSKGIWYRVYVGSFPSVDEANRVRDELLKLPEYTFAQVRRLPRE